LFSKLTLSGQRRGTHVSASRRFSLCFPDASPTANHPNSGTVIRCLTIPIQDAVALNIALEHIMPGWPQRYFDERIKQPTASPVEVEARP
jgi:hypothetical protein